MIERTEVGKAPAPGAIDVLIPVFNGAATIESALDSIAAQTFGDLRMIVVDDGSTDASPAILRRLAERDPRIVVITTPNRGIVAALNTALAASGAALIARFDADDLAFPERLERQTAYLAAHPDCVAVGCNAFHIDRDGRRTGTVTTFRETVVGDPFEIPAAEPYLLHPFLLARREALVSVGGYRYVFHSEDADLYWRLSNVGRLANVVDVLGEYRIHDGSVSAKSVVNGRVQAIEGQRAALSERRRRDGRADLAFPPEALAAYHAAETLRAMLDVASRSLSDDERAYLEVATAAKLLELTAYRPYRLTRDDLRTMRRAIERHHARIPGDRLRSLIFRQLIRPGRLRPPRDLVAAVPWKIMPAALWNLVRHRLRPIVEPGAR